MLPHLDNFGHDDITMNIIMVIIVIVMLTTQVSFRECFFRRRLQQVNCATVSCVEFL